jgi:hypothetical protein
VTVSFEFDGNEYVMPESHATLFAEHLRGYAVGNFNAQEITTLPGVAPGWLDGALPLADAIEDTLTGARVGHVPLAGKAADAAHGVLLVIVHVGDAPDDPPGAEALLTALRKR